MNQLYLKAKLLVLFTSISIISNAQFEFSPFLTINGNYNSLLPKTNRIVLKEPKKWHFGVSEGVGLDLNYKNFHLQLSSALIHTYINHDKIIAQNNCNIKRERYLGRTDQLSNSFSLGYDFLNKEHSKLILFLNAELTHVLGKKSKESFMEFKEFDSSCDDFTQENPNYYKFETQELFYADPKIYFTASTHIEYRYLLGNLYLGFVGGVSPFEKEIFTEPLVLSNLSRSVLGSSFFLGFRLGYTINKQE